MIGAEVQNREISSLTKALLARNLSELSLLGQPRAQLRTASAADRRAHR